MSTTLTSKNSSTGKCFLQKGAALVAGSKSCSKQLNNIMKVAGEERSTDLKNERVKLAVVKALSKNVPLNNVFRALALSKQLNNIMKVAGEERSTDLKNERVKLAVVKALSKNVPLNNVFRALALAK